MSDAIIDVGDNEHEKSFTEEVLNAQGPVLVDFWAPWCGPCKMVAPVLEQLSVGYAGKIKICKVNVDNNQDIAAKFGVKGIPTLVIFKNGSIESQTVGALSKPDLENFIKQYG